MTALDMKYLSGKAVSEFFTELLKAVDAEYPDKPIWLVLGQVSLHKEARALFLPGTIGHRHTCLLIPPHSSFFNPMEDLYDFVLWCVRGMMTSYRAQHPCIAPVMQHVNSPGYVPHPHQDCPNNRVQFPKLLLRALDSIPCELLNLGMSHVVEFMKQVGAGMPVKLRDLVPQTELYSAMLKAPDGSVVQPHGWPYINLTSVDLLGCKPVVKPSASFANTCSNSCNCSCTACKKAHDPECKEECSTSMDCASTACSAAGVKRVADQPCVDDRSAKKVQMDPAQQDQEMASAPAEPAAM